MSDRMRLFILLALCFLASCSKDDEIPDTDQTGWKAVVTTGETLEAERRYHTIGLETEGLAPGNVIGISTDAEWLTIKSDTLPSDGLFDVLPEANTDVEERLAKLTLTNRTDGSTSVVELVQKGKAGDNDDASSLYRVGRGFSCFDEYKCATSIRGSVISEAKLREFNSDSTFISIQESVRGEMYYEFYSAYSLSEMQSKFMEKTSKTILGCRKTAERYVHISATNERYYGYARMVRVVGSKSMDVGALKYICHNPDIIKSGKLPFSNGFYALYKEIGKASGSVREGLIRKMLQQYGTHVIVQTSLGGAIDLAVTYSHNLVTTLEETTETVFKILTGGKSSSNVMKSVNSSFSGKGAINIYGGSESTRKALESNVAQLSAAGTNTLSSSLLNDWSGSITARTDDVLDAVDFTFIPIWELFPNKAVSNEILSVATSMANEQRNIFSDAELGIDNYLLPLTKDIMEFDSKNTTSLVRVLSANNVPIAEICNEYVPAVRSDKRITVVYPIVNGVTRITMGVFPGDGENRPAYLSFSGSDVYVNPLEGYGPKERLSKLYYLHGGLYPTDRGISLAKATFNIKEHWLKFVDSKQSYPVVKIGSGYWTRSDIMEYMDWGYSMYGEFHYTEAMVDGYEFAMIYYTQSENFMALNQNVYDNQGHPVNGRDRWYVPRVADMYHLTSYLGHNHKSMLQGQQSGFEARFLGKCTNIDPGTGEELTQLRRLEVGTRCYIIFKNVDTNVTANKVSGASVLMMKPDYTWQILSDDNNDSYRKIKDYYYPVRLFRTNYYNYYAYGI
ncbi:hypothetical protein EII33_01165 [Bacteroides heparinolyticus]|uniref:Membrane attack complex component/perforin (MACPF) domain protein n=2 Tax=Prevotella heparinolytica TaxID=28113 RepID=A0A3P2ACF8_9BACE|nr:hypothetical protein EII33_01165 [Bacteroides heparinolyticus]VFB13751.1 Membrane attack complex component/perforin (MACPF) domain protein [Bacteroides heparinolyticus]